MAQLLSPGVSVTVIDESYYTRNIPGTVPLIFVATNENKKNATGTKIASGTLKTNPDTKEPTSNDVVLVTSQRELIDMFGTPIFEVDKNNNPIHGSELSEYGLQAAYSYLGAANRAFIVRADVDLKSLVPSEYEPPGQPNDGTYWLDSGRSRFGVFEWNADPLTITGGQRFKTIIPLTITDSNELVDMNPENPPLPDIGHPGDYAMVLTTTLARLYYKKPNTKNHTDSPYSYGSPAGWVEVGSDDWTASWPTVKGSVTLSEPFTNDINDLTTYPNGNTITINNVDIFSGIDPITIGHTLEDVVNKINSVNIPNVTASLVDFHIELYLHTSEESTPITIPNTLAARMAGLLPSGAKAEGELDSNDNPVGNKVYTYIQPALTISEHTKVPLYKISENNLLPPPQTGAVNGRPTGSLWIKTTQLNYGADWIVKKYSKDDDVWETIPTFMYADNATALFKMDPTAGGGNLNRNSIYVRYNDDHGSPELANFKLYNRNAIGDMRITSPAIVLDATHFATGTDYTFEFSTTELGTALMTPYQTVSFVGGVNAADTANNIVNAIAGVVELNGNIRATRDAANRVTIIHKLGGDINFIDKDNEPLKKLFGDGTNDITTNFYYIGDTTDTPPYRMYNATSWVELEYQASPTSPVGAASDGKLWYNSITDEVDIMIHDGTNWRGYLNYAQNYIGGDATDPSGPLISVTAPKSQKDGTPLANGDLWISWPETDFDDDYPDIYRYDIVNGKWILIDKSDQTTEYGILFADARAGVDGGTPTTAPSGTIAEMLTSDFLDPDAPDPALYPRGMLLWNLRRSGNTVKRYEYNYIDTSKRNKRYDGIDGIVSNPIGEGEFMLSYYPHRWLSEASVAEDGAGVFGRKSQRKAVVKALQAVVNANEDIRDVENRDFNLIVCPGYPELVGEMVNLNFDRGQTAFVLGDTPPRLKPKSTTLFSWGINERLAYEDSERGLTTFDEYTAFFYPWGYASDNFGNNIVVPPSHMMLRTINYNDTVGYPWFAPAGVRRGGIQNASSIGYITNEGEFKAISVTNGQRDVLYEIQVNPITFLANTGLVAYGQRTRARLPSSLDRINVARLVIYLRRRMALMARAYIMEPNDSYTRSEFKREADAILLELVNRRGIYDFITICDESNNTPARIDRNEMHLDVAIEPVKAVEFIYIPIRIKNTGEISGGASL